MHSEQYLICPRCAELRLVESPPCADDHGELCPDRACTLCGTAFFVDPPIEYGRRHRSTHWAA